MISHTFQFLDSEVSFKTFTILAFIMCLLFLSVKTVLIQL